MVQPVRYHRPFLQHYPKTYFHLFLHVPQPNLPCYHSWTHLFLHLSHLHYYYLHLYSHQHHLVHLPFVRLPLLDRDLDFAQIHTCSSDYLAAAGVEGAETEAEPEVETDVLLYFRLVVQTEAFSQVVTAAEANGEDGYCCAVVVAVVATVAELVGADEVEGSIAEVDVAEVADRLAERPSAAEPEAQLEE